VAFRNFVLTPRSGLDAQEEDRMTSTASQPDNRAAPSPQPVSEMIPALVAQVYESAPAEERCHLVEALVRPLGVLSLVAIANGIFAKILFRNAGQEFRVRVEDLQNVHGADMAALVHHAQQVSVETVDGLLQQLTTSSGLASSAAAALLIGLLVQRARSRRGTKAQVEDADTSLHPR
jgi:uncharacterized protein YoaH (UPF0181 family)